MNWRFTPHLGKGDLYRKAQSNTINWHVCNLHFNVVVRTFQLKLELDFKDEEDMVE
jgi:hypothetical protein